MIVEITMPMLDEVMEEGEIVSWSKQPGEAVKKGEILLVIETDKATMDIEATYTGTLTEILAQPGETVPCNDPIAKLEVAE